MKKLESIICLFLVLFFLTNCKQDKTHYTIATSSQGGSYYGIGTQLSTLFSQCFSDKKLEVISNDTLSSDVNCQLLLSKKVDFALCQNDVSYQQKGLQTIHINSILPLYPEICFIIYPDSIEPTSLKDLVNGKRIGIGPKNSGTARFMKYLFNYFDIEENDYTPIYTNFENNHLANDSIDISCSIAGFNNERIEKMLTEERGKLFSLDKGHEFDEGNAIDGFCMLYPRSKKYIIPKKIYKQNPKKPILTVAIDAVLLTHSDTPKEVIETFTQNIFRKSQLLSNHNSLLGNLSEKFQKEQLNFPLHEGARIYYERDKPSFFERYAEMIGVLFSIFVVFIGAFSSLQKILHQRQKDLIDEYYVKVIKIENKVKHLQTVDECNENITIIRNIKNEAFLLLVREKVRADESFRIFINQANDTIKYLEHKENRIWQTNQRGKL